MKDAAAAVLVCAVEGRSLTQSERDFFERIPVSGITLFGRNIDHDRPQDVLALIHEIQTLRSSAAPEAIIAIDQEGGRVARLKPPFPNQGPAMKLASGLATAQALDHLRAYGLQVGSALKSLGINVNFAPVLDILTEPENTAIGDRAFGTHAAEVISRAGAFLGGLQRSGVKGCLKHFPGQGDAKVDTHVGRAVVEAPRPLLEERELAPFRALLPVAPMVMIAHCIYPALAPEEASRSPAIMEGLLREKLDYKGVIVSDDMTMGAIPQDEKAWQDAIVEAVQAGADMVLVCRHLERFRLAHEALMDAARKSPSMAKRLEIAAQRVRHLRTTLLKCPQSYPVTAIPARTLTN